MTSETPLITRLREAAALQAGPTLDPPPPGPLTCACSRAPDGGVQICVHMRARLAEMAGEDPAVTLLREAADALERGAAQRREFLERAVCHPGPSLSETEEYDPEADLGDLEGSVLERMDMETNWHRELMEIRMEAEGILARTPDPARSTVATFKDLLAHFVAFHQHLERALTSANEQVESTKRSALDALAAQQARLQAEHRESLASAEQTLTRAATLRRAIAEAVKPESRDTFSHSQLKRRRARLERRLAHIQERTAGAPPHKVAYDTAEASALQTALVLFDEALERHRDIKPGNAPLASLMDGPDPAPAIFPERRGPFNVGDQDAVAEHIRQAGGDPEAATVPQIADALNATNYFGGGTCTPNPAGDGIDYTPDQRGVASSIEVVGGDKLSLLGLTACEPVRHKTGAERRAILAELAASPPLRLEPPADSDFADCDAHADDCRCKRCRAREQAGHARDELGPTGAEDADRRGRALARGLSEES